jgi:hypothetical protein
MPEPQRLRIHDLQRRAAALGTDVAHIVAADAAAERARQGDVREESNVRTV